MTRPVPPRRGTPAFVALNRVHALGGVATSNQLLSCLRSQFNSASRLDRAVIRPLTDIGFIVSVKEGVRITLAGREYIESDAALTSRGHTKLGATPLSAPGDMLAASKHLRLEERRPGSLAYREIPSLIADKRVPFAVGNLSGESNEDVNGVA